MFKQLRETIQQRYDELTKTNKQLFYKDANLEKVWDVYLKAFPNELQQEHQCNLCRTFIRQFSGITIITADLKVESIWDIDVTLVDEEYRASITALANHFKSLPITNVFLPLSKKVGTAENLDREKNIFWSHFALELGDVKTYREADVPSKMGELRTAKETLKRALDEIEEEAVATVLELIAQNSLYKGKEYKDLLETFAISLALYGDVPFNQQNAYCWLLSTDPQAFRLTTIRNSSIGTLLQDLSEGKDLDAAVRSFENKVSSGSYMRPSAVATPAMINKAKEKIYELGYQDSLERRYANLTDLNVENLLYVDKSSGITDVFGEALKDALVSPRSFSKVEEITINDFIEKVLPTSKTIEVLTEETHFKNLFSLITAENAEAPSMFKWNNPFSWSYAGGITDSIKERVKAAGGTVDGVLRFSVQWNDEDTLGRLDFDAHCHEADGTHIYFASSFVKERLGGRTRSTGQLDIDMRGSEGINVENISWLDLNKMKDGDYRFIVHNFSGSRNNGFKAQVEFNGQIFDFPYLKNASGYIDIATVTLKKGEFSIKPALDSSTSVGKVSSRAKWGVKTNTFTKVKSMMFSPNYWETNTGNKHFFFVVEDCISDEEPRPFFNEFLKSDLLAERKAFEMIAGKLKVPKSTNQVSGLGFSDTQSNSLIVRVTGQFQRSLKIKF